MQATKFKEVLAHLKGMMMQPTYRLDLLKNPKSGGFLVSMGTREVIDRGGDPLDVPLMQLFMELSLGVITFESAFFSFFQCGDLQMIKPTGDKGFSQFLEICLQDISDEAKSFVDVCL
jgi:hypothetical protein